MNEYLLFTQAETEEINKITNDFRSVLKVMHINGQTFTELSDDKLFITISYIFNHTRRFRTYKKEINSTWQRIVDKIKADLFNELKSISEGK